MDRESEEVLSHLRAENEFLASEFARLQPLEDELFEEIKSRIEETDISVPVRRGTWWYFDRTREGLSYPISARVLADGDDLTPPVIDPETTLAGEQIILDENVEAEGHDFLSVGVLAVSPDDQWVAVGTDFEGNERHHLTVRPLMGQEPVSDELDDVYYGFAWPLIRDTSSIRALTRPCDRGNCGATSWAHQAAPTYWCCKKTTSNTACRWAAAATTRCSAC